MNMKKKTVLVVEDHHINLKLVTVLLKMGNYEVLQATNADSAIRLAREKRPDLILMDLQLPGMDGLTATRMLKNDIVTKDIPVVALTALAMQNDKDLAFRCGCDGYIVKPIDTENFLRTISEYLKD